MGYELAQSTIYGILDLSGCGQQTNLLHRLPWGLGRLSSFHSSLHRLRSCMAATARIRPLRAAG